MAKYGLNPRRFGWSPSAYAGSKNIGEDLDSEKIRSGRKFATK